MQLVREAGALGDAVVLVTGEGSEHLVVGAVLEHEDDEVLDLAVERLERDAGWTRTSRHARAAPRERRRRGSSSEPEEPAARDGHDGPR